MIDLGEVTTLLKNNYPDAEITVEKMQFYAGFTVSIDGHKTEFWDYEFVVRKRNEDKSLSKTEKAFILKCCKETC